MTTQVPSNAIDQVYDDLFFSDLFVFDGQEPFFQETILQIIWNERLFHSGIQLRDGRILEVVHPGIWNLEAGPDFRDATLFIDGQSARGAVEIHHRPRNWREHGHHTDPAYDAVVVHVVWDAPESMTTFPEGIPLLCLKGCLTLPIETIMERFNPADYAYARKVQPVAWAEQIATMTDDRFRSLLHAYGLARILQKARRAGKMIQEVGLNETAYRFLCDALGYKNNRRQFAELADLLPLEEMAGLNAMDRMALLFGAGGLLPDPCRLNVLPEYTALLSNLWESWWSRRQEFREIHWSRRQRPFNAPERRLLSLALILDRCENSPGMAIVDAFQERDDPSLVLKRLRALLVLDSKEWKGFFRFDKRLEKGAALMGTSRADDFIVNAAIPIYFAWCFLNRRPEDCAIGKHVLLKIGRLQDNRMMKEAVAHLVVPPSRGKVILTDACSQQGLLKMYQTIYDSIN